MGFTTTNGWSHFGIASTGLKAPDNVANGGLTKKLVSIACCADRLNVEVTVPMLMPESMQSAPAPRTQKRLPGSGTLNTSFITTTAINIIRHRSTNSGVILAMIISEVLEGDINNCSTVPASRSLTIAADETRELFKINSSPKTPVTMNHESTRPGL